MIVRNYQTMIVRDQADLVTARKAVSEMAKEGGMNSTRENHLRTAASELLTNMIRHAGGGDMRLELVEQSGRQAVRIFFQDEGPGIEDIEKAMTDGYSTTTSLGNGLPSARRLVDDFSIASEKGHGTRAMILQWF